MPTALSRHGYRATDIHQKIELSIDNLVNIQDTTGEFLSRSDDGRTIDTKGWNDWEWTHGIGLYGLWQYRSLTGSASALKIIQDWFTARLAEGTTKNINTMAVFSTLAYSYEETREPHYSPWSEAWAEWAMYESPRTPYGGFQHSTYASVNTDESWDDTSMMTVLPLAKIGNLLGRTTYVEEAKRQFLSHIKYSFDPSTGSFYHGWKFDTKAQGSVGHNFARARWARGNSWVTIVIPEFIELSDSAPNDALRIHLIDTLEAQCRALKNLQTEEGMWRTSSDVSETEGSYVEASATAGFAYGMSKAVRKRYVGAEYEAVAIRAVHAVLSRINGEGELLDTSFGTGMGWDSQHYKDIPRTSMPYGQAMAIMMLGECFRAFI